MDLGTTFAIPVDWQFLPLATQIEELQHIVEDLQQTQLRRRPTPADGKMRQDKLLKQCETQLRRNRLPTAASSHSGPPTVGQDRDQATWRHELAQAPQAGVLIIVA